MATVDLWPEEIATDVGLEGPTVVLKEQAALLGQKTGNLVEAEVSSTSDGATKFNDNFVLVSSTINYRYELFSVSYPLEFFPATVYWDGYPQEEIFDIGGGLVALVSAQAVSSKEELERELKTIFSAPKTIRIIQALKARSRV